MLLIRSVRNFRTQCSPLLYAVYDNSVSLYYLWWSVTLFLPVVERHAIPTCGEVVSHSYLWWSDTPFLPVVEWHAIPTCGGAARYSYLWWSGTLFLPAAEWHAIPTCSVVARYSYLRWSGGLGGVVAVGRRGKVRRRVYGGGTRQQPRGAVLRRWGHQ